MRWDTKDYRQRLRRRLKRLQAIKVWQLVVLLLLSLIISATLLRVNSLNMADLRHAVITADSNGDDTAINKAISTLGVYVTTHMNTSLEGGFYLSSSYDRARQAAIQAASVTTNPDSALYQQASVECQTERVHVSGGYVQCVLNKVQSIGSSSALASQLDLPSVNLYKINFVSPLWSPDPAGISVAISALILLLIVARIIGVVSLRLLVKRRFRAIS